MRVGICKWDYWPKKEQNILHLRSLKSAMYVRLISEWPYNNNDSPFASTSKCFGRLTGLQTTLGGWPNQINRSFLAAKISFQAEFACWLLNWIVGRSYMGLWIIEFPPDLTPDYQSYRAPGKAKNEPKRPKKSEKKSASVKLINEIWGVRNRSYWSGLT